MSEFSASVGGLTELSRQYVIRHVGQAMAYVWGRQDAGDSALCGDSWYDFAMAYGKHAADFEAGRTTFRRNLRDALTQWREVGGISR